MLRVARARPERYIFCDPAPRVYAPSTAPRTGSDMLSPVPPELKKCLNHPWDRDGFVDASADEEADGVSFKGGKVLEAKAALYGPDRPVIVLDFGALYPSIMRERNVCVSTRTTVAEATRLGVPLAEVPPCPWAEGTWVDDEGGRHVVGADVTDTPTGEYLTSCGARFRLDDDGHVAHLSTGGMWRRCPATMLAFVSTDHLLGMLPGMLAELKAQRDSCKKAGKVAKAAGNGPLAVFWDLQQAAVKVLMNGCYGGTNRSLNMHSQTYGHLRPLWHRPGCTSGRCFYGRLSSGRGGHSLREAAHYGRQPNSGGQSMDSCSYRYRRYRRRGGTCASRGQAAGDGVWWVTHHR